MVCKLQRRGAGPGAFDHHVLEVVAHQLADARRAIHVRDDLEQKARRHQGLAYRPRFEGPVFVAHGGCGHPHRPVVERAEQRVLLDTERRRRELLRESPQLSAAGDRRVVVQIHRMHIAATLTVEHDRDHLPGLGVIAEPRGIRHADELVLDNRFFDLQRFGNHRPQRVGVGAVGDDEELAVHEPVGARRKRGAGERHRECGLANVVDLHARSFDWWCARLRVRSKTWTPSSGGVLARQSGWLRVWAMSARPACQCSCMETRENS